MNLESNLGIESYFWNKFSSLGCFGQEAQENFVQ